MRREVTPPRRRRRSDSAPADLDPAAYVSYVANFYDLFWLLDDGQRSLLYRLTPAQFDDDRGAWGLSLAGAYALQGDRRHAQAYADSAASAFESQVRKTPEDGQLHALLGVALAYLGRKDEAIREGRRGVELVPMTKNAFQAPYNHHQLARIYLLVGEPEQALDEIELLLKVPYLPVARLAAGRSGVRSAPEQSAIPAAGEGGSAVTDPLLFPSWPRIDPTFGPLGEPAIPAPGRGTA